MPLLGSRGVSSSTGYKRLYSPSGTINDPGDSALQLKQDYGYTANGVYYISVNGNSTPVFCLMDSNLAGGGWMMSMKATRGTTFEYDSIHWSTASTLNANDTTRNDGDAKFNVFNYSIGSDILAIFPDMIQGGSLSVSGYGWIWYQPSFISAANLPFTNKQQTLLNVFNAPTPIMNNGGAGYFISDAKTFNGWSGGTNKWSSQVDVRFYGFNYNPNPAYASTMKVRWGFGWNENSEGLYPANNVPYIGTNDVTGGIGLGFTGFNYSAGDVIACCADFTGVNRSMRMEMYVR
jgi:hypothetical protein